MSQTPPSASKPQSPLRSRSLWVILLVVLGAIVALNFIQNPPGTKMIPYSEFKQKVREDKVERVVIHQDAYVDATPKEIKEERESTKDPGPEAVEKVLGGSGVIWRAQRLPQEDDTLIPLLDEKGIKYEFRAGCGEGGMLWIWLMPMLLLFFFWNTMMRRAAAGAGGGTQAMDFAKSRAKLYVEEGTGITFDDVAGCDEAKEELSEVVQFLKEPEKISRLGGQVPKGVLLVGPPGTGKTLLARAVAGEASVPFFNLSGSDFVEMFVGVGAARVRDLFKQAQDQAPCIIFIDELDAIGKSRSASQMQSNDEREQTLNALLVEMDGFDAKGGVIIVAATNRPEILDKALLRPGRFDRQVLVDGPDIRGRTEILKVHAREDRA